MPARLEQLISRCQRATSGLGFAEGRRALSVGVLPSLVHQPMLRRLQPDLVVDVGANRGQFSLDVVRSVPRARLVAFEPLSSEADVYERILPASGRRALHRVALGAVTETRELHRSAAPDSSSLYPIAARQRDLFPGTEATGTVCVDVRTLDEYESAWVADDGLLKMDVQGAELDVLRGAAMSLRRFRWVYAEVSFVELYDGQPLAAEIIDHLRGRGFELVHVGSPVVHEGLAVQTDALFERR